MEASSFIKLPNYQEYSPEEMKQKANDFYLKMRQRRTVRDFSERSVPQEIITECLRTAGTAPSGANLQPWHFVVVSDKAVKKEIREAAEIEEIEFYNSRAPQEWIDMIAPLGIDHNKPFLEEAPFLIAVFLQSYGILPNGKRLKHYYAIESVGLATGILITSLHLAGLVTLTHTPSPMGFLNKILDRPPNERPFLILVGGYPKSDAKVPVITKKSLDEFVTFV